MSLMTRTTKNIGFTVPSAMADEFDEVARKERRTKSELFREVWRMYRTYKERIEKGEDERFERVIEQSIEDALQEKKTALLTENALIKKTEDLASYGKQQAKKKGIRLSDVDAIVYEQRKQRRKKV